jgi:tetratricopeptide (TPR) repeat protein
MTDSRGPAPSRPPLPGRSFRRAIPLLLAVLTLAVFLQTGRHPFIRFDDDTVITDNPLVTGGLTREGVVSAFLSPPSEKYHWQPLTWISFMADREFFGLEPGPVHLHSLLLHLLSAVVLYLALLRMTGEPWRCAFAAALFAVHPLHVESVAWAVERKDTLSGLFCMLVLWSYARYAERPSVVRYLPVAAFLLLGLLAKPMLVTLPFVLLLLDAWPLRRHPSLPPAGEGAPAFPRTSLRALLLEKVPLFALAAASAAVTLVWRLPPSDGEYPFPLFVREANALVATVRYVGRTAWPSGLSVFYPHPGFSLPPWQVAGAAAFVVAATALAVVAFRRRPFLAVGWFWFVGTLVPVSGLVPVGSQAMADHFTYIPLVGLFLAAAWGIPSLVPEGAPRKGLPAAGAAVVLLFAAASFRQAALWRSDEVLFTHALETTRENPVAHAGLGSALAAQGRFAEAAAHYRETLRIAPGYGGGRVRLLLADCLVRMGREADAVASLPVEPGGAEEANRLGLVLAREGKTEQAASFFREAVKLRPGYAEGHYNLAVALRRLGRKEESIPHFRAALSLPAKDADALNRIGVALAGLGRKEEAAGRFREALRLEPAHPEARENLEAVLRPAAPASLPGRAPAAVGGGR